MFSPEKNTRYEAARKEFLATGILPDDIDPAIAASWRRSMEYGVPAEVDRMPGERNMDVLNSSIQLINKRDSYFYNSEASFLDSIGAAIVYTDDHFDIFAIRGSKLLKDELRAINFRFGTNLAESRVGTTALSLSFFSGQEVWCMGSEHYLSVLSRYICVSNCSTSRTNTRGALLYPSMIIIPIENFRPGYVSMFSYILNTHMYRQRSLLNANYLIYNSIIDIFTESTQLHYIAVDCENRIIDLSDSLLKYLSVQYFNIVGNDIDTIFPCLSRALDLDSPVGNVEFCGDSAVSGAGQRFYARCVPVMDEDRLVGKALFLSNNAFDLNNLSFFKARSVSNVAPERKTAQGKSSYIAKYSFDDLAGSCQAFNDVVYKAKKSAKSDSSILILGESGTGKELFAQAIHNASSRKNGAFVSINCAAMPRELISSELFGYVEGAFTGARKNGAPGKIELANNGTLFLDEIGDMPIDLQVHLLKVLEDRTFTRLGDSVVRYADIRIIAATNQNLRKLVNEGTFRLDLYYRLNVFTIELPPLRERLPDIPGLTRLFIEQYAEKLGKHVTGISPEALSAFMTYNWPGNLRELRNAVEYSVNMATSPEISLQNIPTAIRRTTGLYNLRQPEVQPSALSNISHAGEQAELELIRQLMQECNGNKSMVAAKLGISRPALYRRLKKL